MLNIDCISTLHLITNIKDHYNLLLKGFFQKKDFKGGMEFYESIESRNLIPSRETYNTVIKALIDKKDIEQARKISK